eukprot:2999069-Lingulodinium_polyedra.AAC.1
MLQPSIPIAGYVGSARCRYDCTTELVPQSEMVNFGSKNWPASARELCHVASKLLANFVNNDQTLKENLA